MARQVTPTADVTKTQRKRWGTDLPMSKARHGGQAREAGSWFRPAGLNQDLLEGLKFVKYTRLTGPGRLDILARL